MQLLKQIFSTPLPRESPFFHVSLPSCALHQCSESPVILALCTGQQEPVEGDAEQEEEEEEEEELQVVQVSEKEFNFLDYLKRCG